MLKLAWYLVTGCDYWTGLSESPRLRQAPALMARLNELFGNDGGFSPAHTATAVEVMLRMVEHLSDAVPHAEVAVANRAQMVRLLLGFNLLSAHLAQITARLAYHVDSGTAGDLSGLSTGETADLTRSLAIGSCRLEEAAALFKEAHLAVSAGCRQVRR